MFRVLRQVKVQRYSVIYKRQESTNTESIRKAEEKWKRIWDQQNNHSFIQEPSTKQRTKISDQKEKPFHYVLSMFPYPSGKLHMGHVRVYTISDVIARAARMQGNRVINPIGWDSFGLPAENAARQNDISASSWTEQNIKDMKEQLLPLGINFQWDRELKTSSPDYYKWTQWIFLQLYKNGLAYQKNSYVNWDPVDNTVLANEQVLADGTSWRSGAIVERRPMNQWYFKISDYASRLLSGLDQLKHTWPSTVLNLQRNWIGKPSRGMNISFEIQSNSDDNSFNLDVFSTKPETIYGCSFIGISPHHQIFNTLKDDNDIWKSKLQTILNQSLVNRYSISENVNTSDIIEVPGYYAIHPLTGKKLPLYICSYVLEDYGTGAVMGVPAHDERDQIVAKTFDLPIQSVSEHLENEEKSKEIRNDIINKQKGTYNTMYKIRDWLVSRQRYWGAPIPVIHCDSCGVVPVPENQLPVELPEDTRINSLADLPDWYTTTCPSCNKPAKRETDTMDTFVDSSWYYMRYMDPKNCKEIVDKDIAKETLPVDIYIGGNEHAILHLLYARFIHKFLNDVNIVPGDEPFKALLTQGMVHGQTYRLEGSGRYLKSHEVELQGNVPIYKEDPSSKVTISYEKMSKSKFNGLQPQDLIDQFGADTVRLYILFKAPPAKVLEWDHTGIIGQNRWLVRLSTLVDQYIENTNNVEGKKEVKESIELEKELHNTIKSVTQSLTENYSFNVAISSLMKLSNVLSKEVEKGISKQILISLQNLLIMLAPMAPFTSEELWEKLSNHTNENYSSVHDQAWPVVLKSEKTKTRKIIIQFQGKTKAAFPHPEDLPVEQEAIEQFVKSHEKFTKVFTSKQVKEVQFLPESGVINFHFF